MRATLFVKKMSQNTIILSFLQLCHINYPTHIKIYACNMIKWDKVQGMTTAVKHCLHY